jgi:hypothetical protein
MTTQNIDWLLKSDPWIEYRTRIDLLDQPKDSWLVKDAYERMISHPRIESLISELIDWPGQVLNSHKSAGQSYHKLAFIADLGISHSEPKVKKVIEKVIKNKSEEGIIQLPTNVPVHFGGTGRDQFAWALCDAPINLYSIAKLGLHDDLTVLKAKEYLIKLGRDNGYPCTVSKELGRFRGPGKKEDPCPYATMIMLKLMSLYEYDRESEYADKAVDTLLTLWEESETKHPYIFYMGTDFRKLKAPFIWYDILHLADTLSYFSQAVKDKRFNEIVNQIESKASIDDRFIPESEWKAWKDWDFGQKKLPSAWLTFLIYRIRNRLEKRKK